MDNCADTRGRVSGREGGEGGQRGEGSGDAIVVGVSGGVSMDDWLQNDNASLGRVCVIHLMFECVRVSVGVGVCK